METFKEGIATLKSVFEEKLVTADKVKGEIQQQIEALDMIEAKALEAVKVAHAAGYEEALADTGAANSPDKIFSNEQLEAELAPLKEEIVVLKATVETVVAEKVELAAKVEEIPALVDAAKVETKAALLAEYEALLVVESQMETGFKALLAE